MKDKIKTLKSISTIMSFTILSFLFSALLQVVLAYLYGTKSQMDTYFLALSIPLLVSGIFTSTLAVVFIPIFRELIVKRDDSALWELINALTNYVIISLGAVTAAFLAFAPGIISTFAPGLSVADKIEAVSLLRILSFSMLPAGLYSLLVVVYYSEDSFFRPVFARAAAPLAIIVFVLAFNKYLGIKSPAYGYVFGSIIQLLIIFRFLLKEKTRFKFSLTLPRIKIANIWQGTFLVMAGILAFGYILPAEKFLASGLPGGSVSYLGYVERIFSILILLPNMAIPTVILPQLAEHYAIDDINKLRSTFSAGLRSTLFVTLPLVVALFIFREPLIRVFLQRGAFDQKATVYTAMVLACYLGVFFESERLVILNTLYAMRDLLTPFIVGVVSLLIYLGAAVILSKKFSFLGLGLAHSLACLSFSIVNIIVLRARLKNIDGRRILFSGLKMAISAIGAGIVMWHIFIAMDYMRRADTSILVFTKLTVSILAGMAAYLGLCFLFRLKELKQFYEVVITYKRQLFLRVTD